MNAKELLSEKYLDRKPDDDQFAVATSVANTIVAAGAGSGKTQTLATRFAYLVMSSDENKVDKILTLTFTNKAAAEMYHRIYLTLKKFAQELPEGKEKDRAKEAVENFSRAHIQTLDSFSIEILKQAANLYGIRPDFSVGAADTASVIKDLAFKFLMKNRAKKSIQWISEAGQFQETTKFFVEAATLHTSLADSLNSECCVFKESLKKQKSEIVGNEGEEEFLANYEYLEEFYSLLDEFVKEVNSHKRQSGSLTFVDSQKLALRILYEQGQIRQELRNNFTKIMIDEFQDNNGANRDLLLLISRQNENGERLEPDNSKDIIDVIGPTMSDRLFFVGDEKQSIYKFRGADVSVFNELQETIGGKMLHMSNNYRTDELLLEEFNKLFGAIGQPSECKDYSIFPRERTKNFEATFDKSAAAKFPEAKKSKEDADNSEHRMHVCMLNTSERNADTDLTNKESRIYFIGQKIKEVIGNTKNISFKDFSILVKGRTDYAEYARIFSLMHIPYSLDQEANIFAEAPVNDIYNVLRLCVYPSDMKCYCAFLCSPFCGLGLPQAQTILALTQSDEETETRFAFDENSEEEIKKHLQNNDYEKYLAAKEFFNKIKDEILYKPITESISSLWYDYGYRYAPLWTKTSEYSEVGVERTWKQTENPMQEQYDLLFELARTADSQCKDVSWFIDQLALLREASFFSESGELDAKEVDYQTEKKDAVQIMTIHKSKGLEFPYVFVCGIADKNINKGHSSFNGKIYSVDDSMPVVIYNSAKDNYFASTAIENEKEKTDAEFRRLVYVAITRAINHVYIIGEWAQADSSKKSKGTDTQKYLILDIIKYYKTEGKEFSPFEFIDIPKIKKTDFNSAMNANPISIEDYNKKLSEQAALYDSFKEGDIITTPQVPYLRTSPSSLEEKTYSTNDDAEIVASNAYPEINSFVNKAVLQKNDYGTLFHTFMEAWSKDVRGFLDNISNYRFDESLVQKLSDSNKKILLETFCKILNTFLNPKDGSKNAALAALQENREYYAEYEFKTKINSYIVKGTIDAVFQNADGTYTVLDYKTDLTPTPQFYYNQLGCYQKVATDLFTDGDISKVNCILFYAETGDFVDVTKEACAAFNAIDDKKIKELTLKNKEGA